MTEQQEPDDSGAEATAGEPAPRAEEPKAGTESAAAEQAAARAARPRGSNTTSLLALTLAFFAAAASGFLWWQYRVFYVVLDQADADVAVSVQGVRGSVASLEERLATLEARDAQIREILAELDNRLDGLPGRFADLEQRLTAVQGVSQDARRRWLRAEAEYYLTVANAELALAGHWGNAISALELADGKLREVGNPALGGVRERIALELQELRGASLPDVEGLSYSLGRLAARVQTLPMGASVPGRFGAAEEGPAAEAEPGLGRVWAGLRAALAGMVSIERRDESGAHVLTTEAQAVVRHQLELELEIARLGLLRGQGEVVGVSLAAATALLRRDFQTTDAAVESAIALLEEMMSLELAPARPDISGSLALLRSIPVRAN